MFKNYLPNFDNFNGTFDELNKIMKDGTGKL